MKKAIFEAQLPLVIVQARMGSSRLPGKTLTPILGRPLLAYCLDAVLKVVPRDKVVVASSTAPENDALERFCENEAVQLFRGDELNVASRFAKILQMRSAKHFLRICGDSPLLAPEVIEGVIDALQMEAVDMVSTRTNFPSGTHVEGMRSDFFLQEYPKFSKPTHFEHVTTYFYENSIESGWFIKQLQCEVTHPERYKFAVDTVDDLKKMQQIFARLQRPHYEYSLKEKCAFYAECP